MKVCGLASQMVLPGAGSHRETWASKEACRFHERPSLRAKASMTMKPRLCRVFSYSRPGLPRPATSEIDMTQRTIVSADRGKRSAEAGKLLLGRSSGLLVARGSSGFLVAGC